MDPTWGRLLYYTTDRTLFPRPITFFITKNVGGRNKKLERIRRPSLVFLFLKGDQDCPGYLSIFNYGNQG
jgi:hypothetical protein